MPYTFNVLAKHQLDHSAVAAANAVAPADLQRQTHTFAADSGAANAHAVTLTPAPAAYAAGLTVVFAAANGNTGAATLDVNSLGAVAIKRPGGADLSAGEIAAGQVVTVTHDGSVFRMASPAGNLGTLATQDAGNVSISGGAISGATVDGRDIATDGAKLDGIAAGATANSPDATLLDRANHTGTQPLATLSDAGTAAAADIGSGAGQVAAGDHTHSALALTGGSVDGVTIGATTPAPGTFSQLTASKNQAALTTATVSNLTSDPAAGAGLALTSWDGTNQASANITMYSNHATWADGLLINTNGGAAGGINLFPQAGGFSVSTTGLGSRDLVVAASGNVGIGVGATPAARLDVTHATDALALRVYRPGTTTTSSIAEFVSNAGGANTVQCKILADGDLENTNNSYGALSDAKLKTDIRDATPKLADLLRVRVRHYTLIGSPGHKQLGVIAQELEEVFPGLVKETPDREMRPDPEWTPGEGQGEADRPLIAHPTGTTTKSVKYSVFVPMLIQAVQELAARVEVLEMDRNGG